MNPTYQLEQLQHKLSAPAEGYLDSTLYARLSVIAFDGLLHVDFFGSPFNQAYHELCRALAHPAVAERLASIVLRGPDEGANGTCNWNLSVLVVEDITYPALKLFSIQQNGPADHNRMIVAADFDEAGILGQLLQRAPVLDTLIAPSAPDASFFTIRDHPLRYLNVDAGYDTQHFIGNLAHSTCFPSLQHLEFGDYHETYLDAFPQGCTSFSEYEQLFRSQVATNLRSLTLRNPICSAQELAALRSLQSARNLQFKVVRFSCEYFRG
jgi:hypothetical protein